MSNSIQVQRLTYFLGGQTLQNLMIILALIIRSKRSYKTPKNHTHLVTPLNVTHTPQVIQ